MTPSEALDAIREGAFLDHTLWRDPDGETYVLSPPGVESNYFEQGFMRLERLEFLRAQLDEAVEENRAVPPGQEVWWVLRDLSEQWGATDEG